MSADAGAPPAHVTEAEAALYDRQIRLWGLEAQNRMRRAHVLVLGLSGSTAEALKNIVLAGVGTVSIGSIDEGDGEGTSGVVGEGDWSSGFFFREEDLGKPRIPAAIPRIQALNPLCKVRHEPAAADLLRSASEGSKSLSEAGIDVVIADAQRGACSSRDKLIELDSLCRSSSVKFYAVASQGFDGWIFSDLGPSHEYIVEKPVPAGGAGAGAAPTAAAPSTSNGAASNGSTTAVAPAQAPPGKVRTKKRQRFVSLKESLGTSWKGRSAREMRRNRVSAGLIGTWALWEHSANKPSAEPTAMDLEAQALLICKDRGLDPATIWGDKAEARQAYFESLLLATSSAAGGGDFSPTCAILGGVLAQDILNALGGREEPLCNWFVLEGLKGQGAVHQVGVSDAEVEGPGA